MTGHPWPIPKGPVLDWAMFAGAADAGLPAVDALPHQLATTSGRAAIYQALRALALPPGTPVLLPTYHCPTMVAPVVHAGLTPVFYALDHNLAPRLNQINPDTPAGRAGALLVAHYFGMPRSLASERAWCDRHGIALIEDCAHSFFGQAGERAVGHWGDFATASLTKFFAVPEAGLLASAGAAWPASRTALQKQAAASQCRGAARLLLNACAHGRLGGLAQLAGLLRGLRPAQPPTQQPAQQQPVPQAATADALQGCDMQRAGQQPLRVADWLVRRAPRAHMVAARRAHAQQLVDAVQTSPGRRWLRTPDASEPACAPYALPLWVDEPDALYQALRRQGVPVFRWDARWQGTPELPGDFGQAASHHVLQLPCHQSLNAADIQRMANAVNTGAPA
jgi:perosamine synthetase